MTAAVMATPTPTPPHAPPGMTMATLRELVDADGAPRADAPAGAGTAHGMAVGDVFLGNLADPDDNDWVRIELAPATTYVMRLTGHGEDPLADPLLELYDAGGARVAWNDDLHSGVLHSQVVFTTPAADADTDEQDATLTYYLNARSYWRNPALRSDGDYALSLAEQVPPQAPATPGPDMPDAVGDLLHGGPGADVFVFHEDGGHATVADFDPAEDRIELHLYYDRRFDWQALDIEADGADTVIRINQDHSLRLREVAPEELGEAHFVFIGKTVPGMAVGDVLLGTLAEPDDTDWVRIELAPATTYVMRLTGEGDDPLTDPLLELYDADGARVAWNDDLHQGVLHSQVVFTTPAANEDADEQDAPLTYYLNARSYWRNPALRSDGDYALSLAEQAPLQAPVVPPAAPPALLEPPDGALTGTSGPDSLRGDGSDNVLEGGPGPDVLDGGGQPPDGYGDSASYRRAGSAVTVSLETRFAAAFSGEAEGDVLIDIENLIGSNYDDVLSGDVGDNILLGGPGDDILAGGGGADLLVGGPGVDTVSYARNHSNHGVRVDLAAGVADGASAQGDRLAGVENLIGSSSNDELYGSDAGNRLWGGRYGDDLLAGRGGRDVFVFHENDGHDTVLDFDPSEDRIELHLYYGQRFDWQALDIEADGDDTVVRINQSHSLRLRGVAPDELGEEHFVFVGKLRPRQPREESADSGSRTDSSPSSCELVLTGTDGPDTLTGGPCNDRLVGSPGADTLDGGAGSDIADYRKSPAAVTVDLSGTKDGDGFITASGGDAEGDKLKNIESIWGSAYNDILTGDAGYNIFAGGPGADTLDGGAGSYAWVDYRTSPEGVTVNLRGPQDADGFITASGGDAEGDKLKNIRHILGSDHDDILTSVNIHLNSLYGYDGDDTLNGGPSIDKLYGGPGNDTLIGGGSTDELYGGPGADVLDGSAGGIVRAHYEDSPEGVTVNLGGQQDADGFITASGGDAEGDKLKDIRDIAGSAHDDTLTGDAGRQRNFLDGGPGDDTLDGGGGSGPSADQLKGGPGNDTLIGSVGNKDTFMFNSGDGDDVIRNFTQGEDLITLTHLDDIGDLSITTGASDTVISVNDDTITLEGFTGTLVAGDFLF